jgi:hypothetical protein
MMNGEWRIANRDGCCGSNIVGTYVLTYYSIGGGFNSSRKMGLGMRVVVKRLDKLQIYLSTVPSGVVRRVTGLLEKKKPLRLLGLP